MGVLGKKTSLLTTMHAKKTKIEEKFGVELRSFFPEEYRLDILSDLIGFINSPNDGLWIKKPHGMNCGKGIEMIGNVVELREQILVQKRKKHGKYFTNKMFEKKGLKGQKENLGPEKVEEEEKKEDMVV